MIKKTIAYTDFNGDKQEEDFYFHLSKGEFIELEFSEKEGFSEYLQRIIAAEDSTELFATFKKLILLAYGQKDPSGRRFIKSDALKAEFFSSEAYSELITELATDADAAAAFVNGIIPAELREQAEAITEASPSEETPEDSASGQVNPQE